MNYYFLSLQLITPLLLLCVRVNSFRINTNAIRHVRTTLRRTTHDKIIMSTSSTDSSASNNNNFFLQLQNSINNLLQNGNDSNNKNSISKNKKELITMDTIIIGAGIAGLTCANSLLLNNYNNFLLLESTNRPGGRIQTDSYNGYLLDRGFQVFIDSYPESKALFNYKKLQLQKFLPGAMVYYNKSFFLVSDPLRRPLDLLPTIISPIGTLIDKILVGIYSISIRYDTLFNIFERSELTTIEHLSQRKQISSSLINRFFKPFFQGIFLSPIDVQSSRMFEFVFKMFTEGSATLPLDGMGSIPLQIADEIPEEKLLYNTVVKSLTRNSNGVYILDVTKNGKPTTVECKKVVIAADPKTAQKLLNPTIDLPIPEARSSLCLYFGIDGKPPVTDPILVLNGENNLEPGKPYGAVINNVCFPSEVSKNYAPEGKSLASVTVIGSDDVRKLSDNEIETAIRKQLVDWWGSTVEDWEFLRMYRIPYAQPAQTPPYDIGGKPVRLQLPTSGGKEELNDFLYCCGDHRNTATLNGAITSGKKAAEALLEDTKSS